jgi:DNA-binding response OmpR family regulator
MTSPNITGIATILLHIISVISLPGWDGLALASVQPPDLILLDLALPDLDGVEVWGSFASGRSSR